MADCAVLVLNVELHIIIHVLIVVEGFNFNLNVPEICFSLLFFAVVNGLFHNFIFFLNNIHLVVLLKLFFSSGGAPLAKVGINFNFKLAINVIVLDSCRGLFMIEAFRSSPEIYLPLRGASANLEIEGLLDLAHSVARSLLILFIEIVNNDFLVLGLRLISFEAVVEIVNYLVPILITFI